MCGNLYIIIKENCKIVFRHGAYAAVIFLIMVPYIYGIPNLNSEKAADCLGKMVALIGIPLFTPVLKPEQDSDVRDIILTREFPYRASIFFRIVFAVVLSAVMVYFFELYMLYQGCDFPLGIYTVRTVEVSMLIGGAGLLGSALLKSTLAGFLLSVSFAFIYIFYGNFAVMIFRGGHGLVVAGGILLYSTITLLCDKY